MSSPKQLAKRRKLERKRQRKQLALKKKRNRNLAREGYFGYSDGALPAGVHFGPLGDVKMSKVLEEFVEPWNNSTLDGEDYNRLLMMGLIAWNAALEPEYRRPVYIQDMIVHSFPDAGPLDRRGIEKTVYLLLKRKMMCYASHRRPIFGFQLEELCDGGFHLTVMSGIV